MKAKVSLPLEPRVRLYSIKACLFMGRHGWPSREKRYSKRPSSDLIDIELRNGANGTVWLYQQGELVGVRLPSGIPTASSDLNGRYRLKLPAGQTTLN